MSRRRRSVAAYVYTRHETYPRSSRRLPRLTPWLRPLVVVGEVVDASWVTDTSARAPHCSYQWLVVRRSRCRRCGNTTTTSLSPSFRSVFRAVGARCALCGANTTLFTFLSLFFISLFLICKRETELASADSLQRPTIKLRASGMFYDYIYICHYCNSSVASGWSKKNHYLYHFTNIRFNLSFFLFLNGSKLDQQISAGFPLPVIKTRQEPAPAGTYIVLAGAFLIFKLFYVYLYM